ncbi:hypothetical protein RI103_12730 [Paraburkholderia sp. FT54]|uniref:hypothetical protein n=1 Tax=Paraburkholderia sp. FT54 TaxID=3074437 RepID=UPI0028774017|nr:hypothetical protein [Paraburkholderia sp. FT54]WNC88579.1 hypothetical protein RI103_12730 [Paraburkholderia sp. FT54]
MADSENSVVLRPGAFTLSWSADLQYGSRDLTFDGERTFYFAKGDTVNEDSQKGVGVFALNLQNSDLQELNVVAQNLCDKDIQSGGPETVDPPSTFSVMCMGEDGKAVRRSGSIRLIPERFKSRIFDAPLRLAERAWTEGSKIIKLDFETVAVEHKDGHYIVAVKFINSGNRWIQFKTPDQWGGSTTSGRLGVGATGAIHPNGDVVKVKGSWAFGLSGKGLINRSEFKGGLVFLKPGGSEVLKFEVDPDYKALKGSYEFSGIVFMRIEYEGYGWGLASNVDFKPIKTRITIDRDYPSTPQEREQWEKTHRENMSQWPVKPGATFAEDGLYRAVRTSGTARGLLLRPFKAGDVATTDDVRMYTEVASGTEFNGPVQWVWEGSAPTPVKQWSFDIIEGTEHVCKAGAICPRSGRWLARVHSGGFSAAAPYRYDLAGIVTLCRGQSMPARTDGADWEWLGA